MIFTFLALADPRISNIAVDAGTSISDNVFSSLEVLLPSVLVIFALILVFDILYKLIKHILGEDYDENPYGEDSEGNERDVHDADFEQDDFDSLDDAYEAGLGMDEDGDIDSSFFEDDQAEDWEEGYY